MRVAPLGPIETMLGLRECTADLLAQFLTEDAVCMHQTAFEVDCGECILLRALLHAERAAHYNDVQSIVNLGCMLSRSYAAL